MSNFNFGEQLENTNFHSIEPQIPTIETTAEPMSSKPVYRVVPPKPRPRTLPFINEAGQTRLTNGTLISPNYKAGEEGWGIDAEGNAEFNNGVFRGTFIIGGKVITISDITLLQSEIDDLSSQGGGTISLVPNTYDGSNQIFTIPSNVTLNGNGSTIDFGGTAGQFLIQGTNPYSTGTLDATFGSTSITGHGTTWTAGMIGQSILIGDYFYTIANVGSTTSITLETGFIGTNLLGDTYVIATTVDGPSILNITLQNSSTKLIEIRYVNTMTMDSVFCDTGTYGVYSQDSGSIAWRNSGIFNCTSGGFYQNNAPFSNLDNYFVSNIVGTGIEIIRGSNAAFDTGSIQAITGVGVKLTNCYNMDFAIFSIIQCTSHGLELVANNHDYDIIDGYINTVGGVGIKFDSTSDRVEVTDVNILNTTSHGVEFVATANDCSLGQVTIKSAGGDGVKLTATTDRISIIGCSITNSGGWGVNIAASTCDNNQIIAPAFDSNSSGTINDLGTNTFISPQVINTLPDFTAAQDLTAGMAVGITNLLDNQLASALATIKSAAHGITSPQLSGNQTTFAPIGGDKYVYLQDTTATSDTLFAQIVSINRATQAITLGTVATVGTAITPNSGKNMTVCKLDTDKFIIFYLADASTTAIQYRVGTVSGTTITFGTAATFVTAASTLATGEGIQSDFLSTDKGIMSFGTASGANGRAVCFTTSGTVATAGTAVDPGGNFTTVGNPLFIKKIGTDKFVLVCNQTNELHAIVGTVSGTTITFGTQVGSGVLTSAVRLNALQVVSPATDVFVVCWPNSTTAENITACTVSGTTVTMGTTLVMSASITASAAVGIYAQSSSVLYVFYNGASNTRATKLTLSGTTLTSIGTVLYDTNILTAAGVITMDNGYFVVADNTGATNHTLFYQGMAYNFLGFVQSVYSRGQTVSGSDVIISGVESNQSGLVAGAFYQVSNGILTIVDPAASATTPVAQSIVKAISPTQVII